VQGADMGSQSDVALALPFAPVAGVAHGDLFSGVAKARQAAELLVSCQGCERSFLDSRRAPHDRAFRRARGSGRA
jgi:hypothetical protein